MIRAAIQSVLSGYNGTVMAYGQTGTGKTYTIGNLGTENFTERGIMVRAVEDVLAEISPGLDILSISYLQLYLESIQDLLAPDKSNIALTKDATSGEVCFPGATVVEIRDIDQFLHVLQIGEGNRHASNTKMNARSSRSHAILVVHIQRHCQGKDDNECLSVDMKSDEESSHLSTLLKSKFLIIDLAGSERIDESGVDGHMLEEAKFINLSLNSLGKCINALAENSPHIPTRDSKLTRLLSDSFGGTARTSLLITVSPSARHYSQTSSTIMFGQRAMKVVNAVKLKEEYDSERKYKKFECQIDTLTSEVERHQKDKLLLERRLCELEMTLAEAENKLVEAEKKLVEAEKNLPEVEEELGTTSEGQVDNPTNQMSLTVNEMKVINLSRKLEVRSRHVNMEEQLIEFLKYGTKKFTEARSALLIELENHQAAVANPRAHDIVIWFALSLGALFGLYFLS